MISAGSKCQTSLVYWGHSDVGMSKAWSAETLLRGARQLDSQPANMLSSGAQDDPDLLQEYQAIGMIDVGCTFFMKSFTV